MSDELEPTPEVKAESLDDLDFVALNKKLEDADSFALDVRKNREQIRHTLRKKLNEIGAELKDELPKSNRPNFAGLPIGSVDRPKEPRPVLRPGFFLYALSFTAILCSVWASAITILGGLRLPEIPAWALVAVVGGVSVFLTVITLVIICAAFCMYTLLKGQNQPQFAQNFDPSLLEDPPLNPWDRRFVNPNARLDEGIPSTIGASPVRRTFPTITGDPAKDAELEDLKQGLVRPPDAYAHLGNNGMERRYFQDDV